MYQTKSEGSANLFYAPEGTAENRNFLYISLRLSDTMVHLFLSKPNWKEDHDYESSSDIISIMNRLKSTFQSLVACRGRSEARQWLRSMISSISYVTPRQQREIFVEMLRSKSGKRQLASQLLQMMFQKSPQKFGRILAKRSHIFEKFFDANPNSIGQWFSGFADDGGSDHKRGAKAFAQFAFLNRDICWDELEWKGKHGQSPAVVASKPHYFLDLDIQRTIENFVDNVPEFWTSEEFAESLEDGQILFLDNQFFVDFFIDLMYKDDSRSIWKVIEDFLLEEPFFSLCQHLLITLEDHDLSRFLELLCAHIKPEIEFCDLGSSTFWSQFVFSNYKKGESIDELLLLNALINQRRQLLWLVHDEEINNELESFRRLMSEIFVALDGYNNFIVFFKDCFKMKTKDAIKSLALLAWVIHYRLSEECCSSDSWESLFKDNGIDFKKSERHSLMEYEVLLSEEREPQSEVRFSKSRRGKKSKKTKKRKRSFHQDLSDDETLDFTLSNQEIGIHQRSESWSISTDGFSAIWSMVDLPEYLSKHCLSTWMKLFVGKQSGTL